MEQKQRFGGLDRFKFIAAFLVVAIHTSPLSSFSANADFLLTRVLARTAVPFFLMVTGYFLLPQYLFEKSMDRRPLLRFLKKTVLLYGIAILLYLPVNIYAGHFQGSGIGELIRKVLFDGTFYHLWYLPAVLLGVPLVCWAGSRLPFRILGGSCLLLYLIGLFGDSYYGFIANSPIASFYDVLFHVFSYTRNGLFYRPAVPHPLRASAGNTSWGSPDSRQSADGLYSGCPKDRPAHCRPHPAGGAWADRATPP